MPTQINPTELSTKGAFTREIITLANELEVEAIHNRRSNSAKYVWKRRKERLERDSHNQVLIYVRSSDKEALEYQTTLLKERVSNLGLKHVGVFIDSCSGMNEPLTRPGFSNLVSVLQTTSTVSKIITLDQSRISRSRTRVSEVRKYLRGFGIDLVYVEERNA